ncbi:MAG: adenylate/guanylate cyclase [uncultured bacterium]|nr:MAG: adenylate/guanylate cyclase [uncultured bacterium]HLD45049.1 adenylate/guanylate cyclase domain-containing protein [bacterium]
MEKGHDQKALLFVDIVDSTIYYDTLGDEKAQTLMADAMSTLSDIVMQYGGEVVKTMGDAVMATFDSAEVAAKSALFMQRIFQTNAVSVLAQPGELKVRVGINFGDVVVDKDDVFGNAVIVASRVASIAKPEQILTTRDTRDLLPKELIKASRFILKKQLKGLPEEHEIFEILNAPDDANVTTIDSGGTTSLTEELSLILSHGDQKIKLDQNRTVVSIGRNEENDLVIPSTKVSRHHAKIELKNGRYVFTDKSANGSYIAQEGEPLIKVHVDQTTLYQSGKIYLGGRDDESCLVCFSHQ